MDGMEMSGTRSETDKRDKTAEMVSGGGRGSSECGDGRRGRQAQEEERSERQGEEDTTQTAEKSIGNGAQERAPARGEGEEPSLRSFRPLARQTALRPTQKSRAFCGARSSLHLRTDPLTRVTGRSAPRRSFVRSLAHIADLYADALADTAAPVIIAARGVRVARPI